MKVHAGNIMRVRYIGLVFAALLASFGPARAELPAADNGLVKLRTEVVAAFEKGDVDGMLTHVTPDVVVTWQNKTVCRGPAEVRAFYDRMMTGDHKVVARLTSDIRVDGRRVEKDWAVSTGHMNDHFVLTDGSDLPFDSRFTAVTVRRGDRWLVQAFHVSADAFDNPVVHLAARRAATYAAVAAGGGGVVVGGVVGLLLGRRRKRLA